MLPASITKNIEKLVESCGYVLYDIEILQENERSILRVSLAKNGGITLDECAKVSDLLSPLLDVEEPLSKGYFLEVSSPGIERPLKNPRHFCHSIGELVRVKLTDKRELEGELEYANQECIKLKEHEEIPYALIKKANTFYQW